MSTTGSNEIMTEYDDECQDYYIIWQPLTSIGVDKTEEEALEDLRAAAHSGIDTKINTKIRDISLT